MLTLLTEFVNQVVPTLVYSAPGSFVEIVTIQKIAIHFWQSSPLGGVGRKWKIEIYK